MPEPRSDKVSTLSEFGPLHAHVLHPRTWSPQRRWKFYAALGVCKGPLKRCPTQLRGWRLGVCEFSHVGSLQGVPCKVSAAGKVGRLAAGASTKGGAASYLRLQKQLATHTLEGAKGVPMNGGRE